MGQNIEAAKENQAGSRLEQVYLNMPQIRFYFMSDEEQQQENIRAYLDGMPLEVESLQCFGTEGDGVYYYVLLDVSASISENEFNSIKEGLVTFAESLHSEDHLVLMTFGDEVKTVLNVSGEDLDLEQEKELIRTLTNYDQNTLLYEALKQAADRASGVTAQEGMRRVVYVITDGEDMATGKATKEESLSMIQEIGIPVYGFTVQEAERESINSFGEYVRQTGGTLVILESGDAAAGFLDIQKEILNSYEVVFTANSNIVTNKMVNVSLEFVKERRIWQRMTLQNRWIRDEIAPVIEQVVQEGDSQIWIKFSERVSGSNATENFKLRIEDKNILPVYASPGSAGDSVMLTFPGKLKAGEYELRCENIMDCSMEKNLLTEPAVFYAESETEFLTESETETQTKTQIGMTEGVDTTNKINSTIGLLLILGMILFFIAVCLIRKKNKILVLQTENTQHWHVKFKKAKALEEKELFFRVKGQKEEIRFVMKKSMIIGRAASCELSFDDVTLSRQHFILETEKGQVFISNLSQSSFTSVNGVKLQSNSYPLKSGDCVSAGRLQMIIRWN